MASDDAGWRAGRCRGKSSDDSWCQVRLTTDQLLLFVCPFSSSICSPFFFFYGFGFLGKWIRWLFAEGKQGFLGVTVGVDCGLEIPSLTIDSNDGSL